MFFPGACTAGEIDPGEKTGTEAEPERKGPLKDLPSEEGPHIAKIRAMKDNSWLDLGPAKDDPEWGEAKGRGWCGKMPYAPDLRGAFLYGEGRHGGTTQRKGKTYYNDDLFFYDINANRWVCVYPGMEVGKYNLTINEDGFEVNAEGNPVPVAVFVHSYTYMTYDTDRKMFMHMWRPSGYWRKPFPKRVALVEKNGDKLNGIGRDWSTINQASPWMYDTTAGHWRRYKTKSQTPGKGSGALFYIEHLKKCCFFPKKGAGVSFYDPEENDWQAAKSSGPLPPRPGDAPSCYDSKRRRVYIGMGAYPSEFEGPKNQNRVWAFDIEGSTWIDLKATGELPPVAGGVSGCSTTKMHYDSANDAIIFISVREDANNSLETRGIYAYSPDENKWEKAAGSFPESWEPRAGTHTFYDPELNAHFIYRVRDKRLVFVYRYKNPQKTEKD